MARKLRFIGSFRDVNYGVDNDGELFHSIAEAKRSLLDRYVSNGQRGVTTIDTEGRVTADFFPAVTPEAYFLLWPLPEDEQVTVEQLRELAPDWGGIRGGLIMEDRATIHVWIGRRNAARHGTPEEHEDVERIRKGADVREAGSIVVLL